MRLTLGDAKDSRIDVVLNISSDDDRFVQILNEAIERLVKSGQNFYGSRARYRLCATENCVTLPRQFAAIEAAAVNSHPIQIRNGWFEFLENGAGIRSGDTEDCSCSSNSGCGSLQCYDRGQACAFTDIIGTNKKIKVYADVTEDAAAKILLQGYDENGNWIRTETAGVWTDGEYVSISTTPQTSTKFFSSLVAVQKPETNGSVRLYEYDTDLATQRALAIYEYDETRPSYRRALLDGISGLATSESCPSQTLIVAAKLEFMPVRRDVDWLLIGNMAALKLACQAIKKEEANLWDEAEVYWSKAKTELDRELKHYTGKGVVNTVRYPPRTVYGGAVQNII